MEEVLKIGRSRPRPERDRDARNHAASNYGKRPALAQFQQHIRDRIGV